MLVLEQTGAIRAARQRVEDSAVLGNLRKGWQKCWQFVDKKGAVEHTRLGRLLQPKRVIYIPPTFFGWCLRDAEKSVHMHVCLAPIVPE